MIKYMNYVSNLLALEQVEAVLGSEEFRNEAAESFIISGTVSKFAMQMELGWKLLAELLRDREGISAEFLRSPRGTIKEAQAVYGDDFDGDLWINMLSARNSIVHMYDESLARELAQRIRRTYVPAFQDLKIFIDARYGTTTLNQDHERIPKLS